MSRGLGLDLGTGLSKLARAVAGEGHGEESVALLRVVPTAVAYRDLSARIPAAGSIPGRAARGVGTRYDGFPAMLARGPAGTHGRTPADVTHEFLRLFLDTPDRDDTAAPPPIAAAVPPGELAELAAVLSTPGRPAPRLVPAPLAIVLYLRHRRPDLAAVSHFVVCDLGASAATLSLCGMSGPRLQVVDFTQVTGSGPTQAVTRDEAGGRPPLLVEALALALAESAGPAAAVRRWRQLEVALADGRQRERLDAVLEAALADPTRYSGTTALRIGDLAVTAAGVLRACAPLADRCGAELASLLSRQEDPAWLRPGGGTRVVLTGGLSVLRPVREALLRAAGLDPAAPGEGIVVPEGDDVLYAPVLGAALVAARLAEPGDRYPHALRLPVHRQFRDQIVSSYLELAPPGSVELDLARPLFARERGRKTRVAVRPGPGSGPPVPVEVVLAGGTVEPAAFAPASPPPPGLYHIGVRGHPNGAAIVLQPADGGDVLSYPLAQPGTGDQVNGSR